MLRGTGTTHPDYGPQPDLAALRDLAARVRDAGLPVDLELDDDRPVPPGVALSAFRIVQEALTNVRKHAGMVPTRVAVHTTGCAVRIEVVNEIGGVRGGEGDGHGIVGMRERVRLYDGTLEAGPSNGTWRVRATLPLQETQA